MMELRRSQFTLQSALRATLTAGMLAAASMVGAQNNPKPQAALNDPKPSVPSSTSALAERAARPGVNGPSKRVLALYYPWYGMPPRSPKWMHQEQLDDIKHTLGSHTHFPANGPYDSTDPAVLDRHLKAASGAGIDTLVCSWWGKEDPTDKAVQALLARATEAHDTTVCVYWERLNLVRDKFSALEELSYILGTLAKSPAYLRIDGKPVIFLYQRVCQSLTSEDWAWVLNEAGKKFAPGVIAVGQGSTQTDLLLWDGLHSLGVFYQLAGQSLDALPIWMQANFETPVLAARRSHQLAVIAVTPGFDDRKANSLAGQVSATLVDRQDGKLFSTQWELAIKQKPDWILINSFNQWHAGTEIEPSLELGDKYLKLTKEYSGQFKAATANR